MFFIAGISPKIKPLGKAESCPCPVCGAREDLNVIYKYMTPHVFFIPTFRFHSEYIAVCPSCASVMELDGEKGKAIRRGDGEAIRFEDMTVVQYNFRRGGNL